MLELPGTAEPDVEGRTGSRSGWNTKVSGWCHRQVAEIEKNLSDMLDMDVRNSFAEKKEAETERLDVRNQKVERRK